MPGARSQRSDNPYRRSWRHRFIDSLSTTVAPNVALIAHGSLTDPARAEASSEYLDYELALNFVSAAQWMQRLALAFRTHRGHCHRHLVSGGGPRTWQQPRLWRRQGRAHGVLFGTARPHGHAGVRHDRQTRLHRFAMTAHVNPKGALWATPETIADGILKAIDRQRDVVYLPGFWALVMLVIKAHPRADIQEAQNFDQTPARNETDLCMAFG